MFGVLHLGNTLVTCSLTVYCCALPWSLLLQLRAGPPHIKKSQKWLNQLICFNKYSNCSVRLSAERRNRKRVSVAIYKKNANTLPAMVKPSLPAPFMGKMDVVSVSRFVH